MLKLVRLMAVATATLILFAAKSQAQIINVVIDGQPVAFTGTPPQEINNSVLVPLRGVFEQLGANVQYNPDTKTIFAVKGSTNVSLALGSATAYVDNQPEQLAQPPTVLVGTTLVPLRFVAESFGAYVEWQPQTSTVQIQTSPSSAAPISPSQTHDWHDRSSQTHDWQNAQQSSQGWQNTPSPSQGSSNGQRSSLGAQNGPAPSQNLPRLSAVNGRIIGVDNPSSPTNVTVSTQNGSVQVNLDYHTRIIENFGMGSSWRPAGLRDLKVGDDISVQALKNGTARIIQINVQAQHIRS